MKKDKGTVKMGLNERQPFNPDKCKPPETPYQRPKKRAIMTGGKKGF